MAAQAVTAWVFLAVSGGWWQFRALLSIAPPTRTYSVPSVSLLSKRPDHLRHLILYLEPFAFRVALAGARRLTLKAGQIWAGQRDSC